MMKIAKTTVNTIIPLILLSALAACGGGGGGAAPATSPATGVATAAPASPVPEVVPAVPAAVAAPTYTASGEELNAFTLVNQERARCGFGLLLQSAQLDQAAAAHADYLVQNNLAYGHSEAAGLPGFTGATEGARAAVAGYSYPVGANLATYSGPALPAGSLRGTKHIRDLLAAPYHLLSLVDGYGDIGIGYNQKITGATEKHALNITLGRRAGVNELAAGEVYTYPCAGSEGVNVGLADETPSPIPANLTQNNTLYGSPIAVRARIGQVLALTSVVISPTDGSAAVSAQIVTSANDPQRGSLMRQDSAYVLPLSPLRSGSRYMISIAGQIDGAVFSKTFSFKTAD